MRGSRTVYILPNLFTTAALFCGFYAILAAIDGRFTFAAVLIFVAMLFDGCDGRVARLTHTESAFGVQYDSLADLISFGVAPALVMYEWSLHYVAQEPMYPAKLGWMTVFIYTVCAALRLARFNVQVDSTDKAVFVGLPSPSAAAIVAGFVWVGSEYHWNGSKLIMLSVILVWFSALAMVSNFKYYSFKTFKLESRIPFSKAVLPACLIGLIFLEPAPVLFGLFLLYGLHGPIWTLWRLSKRRQGRC
ncbi:MAG: CDP-diacylglycerol--serine O-phosphatidyltransferase [Cardiobacteriaceae bacterium]|nr:CDP-diacylglycerol--serine O-phosphatidyltransferase [Cardiobacteriaceae bacterium]